MTTPTPIPASAPVFTVHQIALGLQNLLGVVYSDIRVCGEITNLARTTAGHTYFSLKDASAQMSAVLWNRMRTRDMPELRDGMECVCRGRLDVYPPRGTYQLVVQEVEEKGQGSLEQAFIDLKNRLAREGLFAPEHKVRLPRSPLRVGVVTSPDGAAIRDFLQVLKRRWSALDVCIYPAPVQGKGAGEKLADGVRFFNRFAGRLGVDVIVVTRGGGSMEDLWEFNSEVLIRAIFDSELPVVSAVGHEIDVTLCDLVADRRALTPSEAAEILAPDAADVRARLTHLGERLRVSMENRVSRHESNLENLRNSPAFRFPYRAISERTQRVDELGMSLNSSVGRAFTTAEQRLATAAARLGALSPLNVLARGYSITESATSGQPVTNVVQLRVGEQIRTRFAHGGAISTVVEILREEKRRDVTEEV